MKMKTMNQDMTKTSSLKQESCEDKRIMIEVGHKIYFEKKMRKNNKENHIPHKNKRIKTEEPKVTLRRKLK